MPHQWILWRSLLDQGEGSLAFEIAETALKVWKRETDDSYCCFEHFMSANGRGSGFHQFSGLSTPVLMFFESYYTPGTVTVGFNTTVTSEKWNEDKTELTVECTARGSHPIALVCMRVGNEYRFTVNGEEVCVKVVTDGAFEIPLTYGKSVVSVEKKK
jgi:hypothetical protein